MNMWEELPEIPKSLKIKIIDLTIAKIKIMMDCSGICNCLYQSMYELMPEYSASDRVLLYATVLRKYVEAYKPDTMHSQYFYWPLTKEGTHQRIKVLINIKRDIRKENSG